MAAYYHLKNLSRMKRLLDQQHVEKLVIVFVFSWLDYCNGVFTGLCKKSVKQLQLIQNSARVVSKTKKTDHIRSVLRSLHWLPVSQRMYFKILLLVQKAMHGSGPKCILICCYLMNHPDPSGRQGQVSSLSPKLELNMEKQHSVFMLHISAREL